jgi:hypothetical protein
LDATVDFDGFQKHRAGTNPKSVIPVKQAVGDEFLLGFGVLGDAENEVVLAFVVAVATGERAGGVDGDGGDGGRSVGRGRHEVKKKGSGWV